jgi:hypothetical protein
MSAKKWCGVLGAKIDGEASLHDFSAHANGFSQWLMTEFMSAEFIRRKFGHIFSSRPTPLA